MKFDPSALAARLWKRVLPFFDLSAWVLVLVALVPLFFIDRAMALTLVQWTLYGLALAGVSVVICRVVLPQIDLSECVREAIRGGPNALPLALVTSATVIFLAVIFLGLVLWAKA